MRIKMKDRLKNAKAADSPRKAEKVYRPPGTAARRFGMIVFWGTFAFILLVFLSNIIFGGSEEEMAAPVVEEDNPAAGLEGVEFAKKFAETYFTWTPTAKGWEKQQEELAPMLGKGLAADAGIIQVDQNWSSTAEKIGVERIVETGEKKASIILSVVQRLAVGEKKEIVTHMFAVPVEYNASFALYELPSFTAVPETNQVRWEKLAGDVVDGETERNLKNFLATFFQSYAADSADKLSYFLESDQEVKGLEGSVEFIEVTNSTVVQTSKGYDVSAYVVMAEPKTETKFTVVYRLSVMEQGGRYVVTKLNQGVE